MTTKNTLPPEFTERMRQLLVPMLMEQSRKTLQTVVQTLDEARDELTGKYPSPDYWQGFALARRLVETMATKMLEQELETAKGAH